MSFDLAYNEESGAILKIYQNGQSEIVGRVDPTLPTHIIDIVLGTFMENGDKNE